MYLSLRNVLRPMRYFSSVPPCASPLLTSPLFDTHSRRHTYLRLSLTERCNLRCHYCMPSEGVPLTPSPHLLTRSELTRLSQIFVNRGVDKIRLTGGEPLLRKDIVEIVEELNGLTPKPRISLTTNGILLGRYLEGLKKAGLSGVNISLDTLVEAKFEVIARRKGHGRVVEAIKQAIKQGVESVKVNVVVMRGVNEEEVCGFVRMTEGLNVDVRFIEYMPFNGNEWKWEKFVGYGEMLEGIGKEFEGLRRLEDGKNSTSKGFKVDGFKGKIGFISSMTKDFCEGCNRLRVTADGNLKSCLFGDEEISLKECMREGGSDEEICRAIDRGLKGKFWKLGGKGDMFGISRRPDRSMIRIGG